MYNGTKDDTYENMAEIDKPFTQEKVGTGAYQCFCKELMDKKFFYGFFTDKEQDTEMCGQYNRDKRTNVSLGYLISFTITATNFLIRMVSILFIKKIRQHRVSKELRDITFSIFLGTFFNTAFLLLISQAKF